jgi:hypothetical protein
VSPKLKSLLARAILVGGVALVAAIGSRYAPHDQTLAIRLGNREVTRVDAVITESGADEPTSGFSQVFSEKSPRFIRHDFRAATGTYIVVISFVEKMPNAHDVAGDVGPNLIETSFERRVSLVGGEVIVSPD